MGPTVTRPVQDPLAVILLNNRLCILWKLNFTITRLDVTFYILCNFLTWQIRELKGEKPDLLYSLTKVLYKNDQTYWIFR